MLNMNLMHNIEDLSVELAKYESSNSVDKSDRYVEVYYSNVIEGNKLTLVQTKELLTNSGTFIEADILSQIEARNLFEALYFADNLSDLNEDSLKSTHKILLKNTGKVGGKYSKYPRIITNCSYIPPKPSKLEGLMVQLFEWLNDEAVVDSNIVRAILFGYYLVSIHPFPDGNGRLSRLTTNWLLERNGYCAVNVIDKDFYYVCLEACQTSSPDIFQTRTDMYINFYLELIEAKMTELLSSAKDSNSIFGKSNSFGG